MFLHASPLVLTGMNTHIGSGNFAAFPIGWICCFEMGRREYSNLPVVADCTSSQYRCALKLTAPDCISIGVNAIVNTFQIVRSQTHPLSLSLF